MYNSFYTVGGALHNTPVGTFSMPNMKRLDMMFDIYPDLFISTNDLKKYKVLLYQHGKLQTELINKIVDENIPTISCEDCEEARTVACICDLCMKPLCVKCCLPYYFSQYGNVRYETGMCLCMDCSIFTSKEHWQDYVTNQQPNVLALPFPLHMMVTMEFQAISFDTYLDNVSQQIKKYS